MKRILYSLLLLAGCFSIRAQVPQGFNYQAIARDNSGSPVAGATIEVKLGILSDTLIPTIVREELFTNVKTNSFGLFTLVIGTGTYQAGSQSRSESYAGVCCCSIYCRMISIGAPPQLPAK